MENVFTAAKPFIVYGKFLGLFPLSIEFVRKRKSRKSLKFRIKNFVFLLILISFFILLLIRNFVTGSLTFSNSNVSAYAWKILATTCDFLIFICCLFQIVQTKNVAKFFNLVQQIDIEVRERGIF
jgi:hypothetical protein